jgi:uncharacterized protein YndB with AHSA1/START domain
MPRLDNQFITGCTLGALAAVLLGVASASAATLTRSVDVKGSPAQVWSAIGPFCAIARWHPAIGTCTTDGKAPPTRTLVTKDGARFVELQTARSDAAHSYSYSFTASPIPVSHYTSTLSVAANGAGVSTVTWTGAYTPNEGKAKDADAALSGIYESGLAAIKAQLAE